MHEMETRQIALPDLPKGYVWVKDAVFINNTNLLRLTIYRKWGWLQKKVVEGDFIALSADSDPEDSITKIMMVCDMLMLQLPHRVEIDNG